MTKMKLVEGYRILMRNKNFKKTNNNLTKALDKPVISAVLYSE